ncbi:PadR family transcriptional regulator [Prauserella cavernicola]|uniref:PadR family transcriptional regulator n=1 Tax=Prauserella cavernicola TaxID=2800127 RepID=A0A934QSJ1_9PSEU|nr:PadR family transcriptional regulator [Prauserella cavernicola]MBK1785535.1 PadR family transcriptional regulator [Prauserella cavernicola]
MSATRLLVLGVVRMYGSAHGYQVRRELLSWSADKWANVAPGSIYHALKKMADEQLLEQVRTEATGAGPDRVAYRLTDEGEAEFTRRLHQLLSEVKDDVNGNPGFLAAVAFLPALERERAIGLLKYRLTQLKGNEANMAGLLEHGTQWGQPQHVNALYRLWQAQLATAVEWTADLVERLRSGEYVMADEGPSFGEPGPHSPARL